jgi:hypothetical protein
MSVSLSRAPTRAAIIGGVSTAAIGLVVTFVLAHLASTSVPEAEVRRVQAGIIWRGVLGTAIVAVVIAFVARALFKRCVTVKRCGALGRRMRQSTMGSLMCRLSESIANSLDLRTGCQRRAFR